MGCSDLLDRMKQRDPDAYLEMTDRYGWAVYNTIRKKHSEKAIADKVYDQVMQKFWSCTQDPEFEDPMEALLCMLADYESAPVVLQKKLPESFAVDLTDIPPSVQASRLMEPELEIPEKPRIRFGSMIVILLLILLAFWVVAGLLMERELVPFMDLGYSWFCRYFQQLLRFLNLG